MHNPVKTDPTPTSPRARAGGFSIPIPTEPGDPAVETGVPRLDAYIIERRERKPLGAVMICPGGGYSMRAPHEGADIAQAFNAAGFHALVLQYRVAPARHPAPLRDAVNAMRLIRTHAAIWKVDPHAIAACGFSAGGHLAGSLAFAYDEAAGGILSGDAAARARPNALILGYAVISSGPFGHRGSFDRLFGRKSPAEDRDRLSLEHRVRPDSPPAFIWHTASDDAVPVDNALALATAMRRFERPFELHIYAEGRHGLGLARERGVAPRVGEWFDHCVEWLQDMGWTRAETTDRSSPRLRSAP